MPPSCWPFVLFLSHKGRVKEKTASSYFRFAIEICLASIICLCFYISFSMFCLCQLVPQSGLNLSQILFSSSAYQ